MEVRLNLITPTKPSSEACRMAVSAEICTTYFRRGTNTTVDIPIGCFNCVYWQYQQQVINSNDMIEAIVKWQS